jgi:two-component system sensor histidine kinase YesM
MLGYNGGYTVIMIDLQATIEEQSNNVDESEGFLLYCNSQGEALTNNDSVRDEDLILSKFNDLYYVTQSSPRHLVVSSYSDSANAYILYFTPYRGYLFYMSKIQMIFFIISISMILLIPFYYRIISKSYFKPMANLMSTMEKIRDGSINEKVQIDFRIKELLDINMTFNQMMDEIKHLKIESYERELQRKQAFLQYLQMQIKPHFFLNCLKILYSMAEQRKYDKIQNMIIGLSNYLRNFFKDNMSLVTVKYEIEYVENYINLQKNSMQQDVECIIETDNSIVNYCIPVLLIQTFVENCIKYARKPDESLSIQINIIELTLEDNNLIDIIIQDNGYGFKEEILEQLNSDVTFEYSDKNVGITNVKQRLYLLYGEKANVQFSNTKQGARCEIIIPATIKPVSGANDEHIDYR